MAECEICGRTLRTGRKYCWEHRHTNQSEESQKLKSFNHAEEFYPIYQRRRSMKIVKIIFIGCLVAFFLVYYLIFQDRAFEREHLTSMFKFFSVYIMLLVFIVILIAKFIFKAKTVSEINRDIYERSPDYIEWIRGWIASDNEERNFKKAIIQGREVATNHPNRPSQKVKFIALLFIGVIILIFFSLMIYSFLNEKKGNSNFSTENPEKSFENPFEQSCYEKLEKNITIKTLYNTYYFATNSEAEKWIYEKYPESNPININRAKFFTRYQLDKAEFPIFIFEVDVILSPGLIGNHALYVCDQKGIAAYGE